MNRRELLSASLCLSALALDDFAYAQSVSPRVAVVIGVDQTGSLPKLQATDGANAVADWLAGEGFEVKRFVDTQQKVRQSDIFDCIAEFVGRGNVEMLVLYFAGHGFQSTSYNEWWLLSDAPQNPNEAISVIETVTQAKLCGIPNVVIISDACRSTPDSLQAAGVRGVIVFPNLPSSKSGRVDVDRFSATSAGDKAFELPVSESVKRGYQGIFTASFLEAFASPDDDMVKSLADGSQVVPNRNLSGYLEREVQKRAQQKSIMMNQVPDVDVNSNDLIYMGRAKGRSHATSLNQVIPSNTIVDYALQKAGARFTNGGLLSMSTDGITDQDIVDRSEEIGFSSVRERVASSRTPDAFMGRTGFFFPGVFPTQIALLSDGKAELSSLNEPNASGGIIDVSLPDRRMGMNIAVRFGDGSGTILSALDGYICNVAVSEDGGIDNISYAPSGETERARAYAESAERLRRLQGVFAAASHLGALRIKGNREEKVQSARSMAQDIRFRGIPDVTLALYAAYAFWATDHTEELASLTNALDEILGVPLFDLHLLLNRELSVRRGVPSFPMLTQGWDLLRVLGATSRLTDALRPHLKRSVWTIFEAPGAELLFPVAQIPPR